MKNYLNQTGSLPLVLIIVFVMTMSVIALTSLHISEQINMSYSATKDADRLYQEDSVKEMTLHAFQQVLRAKKIEYMGNEQILTNDDFALLESIVNTEILPKYQLEDYRVFVSDEYLPPTVDYFCLVEMDITGQTPDGFDCLHDPFDVRLNVQITHRNIVREVIVEANNLHLETAEDKQSIFINTIGAEYDFKKK